MVPWVVLWSVIVEVTGHTHCSVSLSLCLSRGAMGCSVVCDCGSYWSYSLFSESFLVSSSWCHGLFCDCGSYWSYSLFRESFLVSSSWCHGLFLIEGLTGHTHCSVSLSLSLPRGAESCSVVRDCGSYWSNSLFSESFLVSSSWCHG